MDGTPESATGAPQQAGTEFVSGSHPVEAPKPQDDSVAITQEPNIFTRAWNVIRGKNHQRAEDIHAELAAQKSAVSDPTIAEMAQGQNLGAPVGEASVTGAVAETTLLATSTPEPGASATKSEELAPIGGTGSTNPTESGQTAENVDQMITDLEKNVQRDAAESEEDATPAEDSATIAPDTTQREDTGEALNAVAASMVKIPEKPAASPVIVEPAAAVETTESDTKPANVVDIAAAPVDESSATDSPKETENMTVLPTQTASQSTQGTGAMAAGSGSQFESNTPEPVQEAAIGMRNAVDASTESDKADSDLAAREQNVIDITEARAQRDEAMKPLADTPNDQSGKNASTTPSQTAQSPAQSESTDGASGDAAQLRKAA